MPTSTSRPRRRAPGPVIVGLLGLVGLLQLASVAHGQVADPPAAAPEVTMEARLQGDLAILEPLLGTWEIEARWSHGTALRGRSTYEPAMDGLFVIGKTWVSDGGGPVYLRYVSTYGAGEEPGTIVTSSANVDGSISPGSCVLERTDAGVVMTTEWSMEQMRVAETFTVGDGEALWVVRMAQGPGAAFQEVMRGTWRKISDLARPYRRPSEDGSMTHPIDDRLFVGRGRDVDHFEITRSIAASPRSIFDAFTDPESFPAAFAPDWEDLSADIELAIGGPFEWLWDGVVGSNGCQVLSYVPDRMVSFSWNAPPGQDRTRALRTWVVVEFEPAGDGETLVRLTHLGFGPEPHWQETRAYFERAWVTVLDRFAENLEAASDEG